LGDGDKVLIGSRYRHLLDKVTDLLNTDLKGILAFRGHVENLEYKSIDKK
jgi:hypothetical protein